MLGGLRAYGVLGDGGKLADQTTLISVTDTTGKPLIGASTRTDPRQVLDAGAAYILTDILAGNTDPNQNPYWGKFELTASGGQHRPATLKTGTNNDAKDLNAYGYLGTPSAADRTMLPYSTPVLFFQKPASSSVMRTVMV